MDFTRMKEFVVPEGVVKKIEIGGRAVWQSETEEMTGPFTAAQSAAIRAGDFTDVPVGFCWEFEDVPYTYVDASNATVSDTYSGTMRVADCDYYLGTGDVECTTHHVVVVPDANMYRANMNNSSITTGGYVGSKMRTVHLRRAEAIFKACFGVNHILTHREYLTTSVYTGNLQKGEAGGKWCDSTVELMNEPMVWGTNNHANLLNSRVLKKQLSLFKNNSDFIAIKSIYVLRTVVKEANSNGFLRVMSDGSCQTSAGAIVSSGVRPYALIY